MKASRDSANGKSTSVAAAATSRASRSRMPELNRAQLGNRTIAKLLATGGGSESALVSTMGNRAAAEQLGASSSSEEAAANETGRALPHARFNRSASPSEPVSPLSPQLRTSMESELSAPLDNVRVHTGPDAARAARSLGTDAFTVGEDIHFGFGQFRPNTGKGQSLLGHELSHVLQQRNEGPKRVARWPGDASLDAFQRARAHLATKTAELLLDEAHSGKADIKNVIAMLYTVIDVGHQNEHTQFELDTMYDEVDKLDQITTTITPKTANTPAKVLGLVTSVSELIWALGLPPGLGSKEVSFGVVAFAKWLGRGVADCILQPLVGGVAGSLFRGHNFGSVVFGTLADTSALLELELEGSLDHLIDLRASFNSRSLTEPERAAIGQEIGTVARRILLINDELEQQRAKPLFGGAGATPLDDVLKEAAARIDAVRAAEQTESQTLTELGDEPKLLRPKSISLVASLVQRDEPETVRPEEAFPKASDKATERFVETLANRVKAQAKDVAAARETLIPGGDDYSAKDFLKVYNYWFSFFSRRGQYKDEGFKDTDAFYRGMYRVAGMADEGALLHLFLIDMFSKLVDLNLHDASEDFGGELRPAQRKRSVTGTARDPNYQFADLFAGTGASKSTHGERASRATVIARKRAATRYATKGKHDGWLYLIKTPVESLPKSNNKMVPNASLLQANGGGKGSAPRAAKTVEELKVMQPEVANYLLARMQHLETLENTHTPGVGDSFTAQTGVEVGVGIGERKYLKGQRGAVNPRVRSNQRNIQAAARAAGARKRLPVTRLDLNRRTTAMLLGDLEKWLNSYFVKNDDVAHRLFAVIHIANLEHNAKEVLASKLTPWEIGKGIAMALGVQALNKIVAKIATRAVARSFSRGLSRVFTMMSGGSDISAMAHLIMWIARTSAAEDFRSARVLGYFGQFSADALGNLLQTAITMPAVKAFGVIPKLLKSPRTVRELTNSFAPILADPKARGIMLKEVRAEMAAIQKKLKPGEKSAELDALKAVETDLGGVSHGIDPAKTMLGTRPERTPAEQMKEVMESAGMSAKQKAEILAHYQKYGFPEVLGPVGARTGTPTGKRADPVLQGALPRGLQDVVAWRDPKWSGRGVEVHYTTRRVRGGLVVVDQIHVRAGASASVRDIELHIPTVRRMNSYRGVSGVTRGLWHRLSSIWSKVPADAKKPGSLGFEARGELKKLPKLIDDRLRELKQLQNSNQKRGLDPALRGDIDAELVGFRAQLARHAEVLRSLELQTSEGRGYVAAQSTRNAEAKAAKYPDPPPYHAYRSPRKGVFELYMLPSAPKNPRPQGWRIKHTKDGKIVKVKRTDSPRRTWSERRLGFIAAGRRPKKSAPALEAALARMMQPPHSWSADDVALVRRWAGPMEALHNARGGADPNLLPRLLGQLGKGASSVGYDKFRRAIRRELVNHILRTPSGRVRNPRQQMETFRTIEKLDDVDPATLGRLFTEYRRARFGLKRGAARVANIDELPDASTQLPGGRAADSAIKVKPGGPKGAPPPGRYLVDDKAGDRPFDPVQAKKYSDDLKANGTMVSADGKQKFDGLVYFFQNQGAFDAAMRSAPAGLHPNIRFAYFDPSGVLKWH